MTYEAVIGLEVHAQLLTQSKLFAPPSTRFGAEPNRHVSEICLGLPGVLPVLNEKAVELAVRAGLGLGCTVQRRSEWSRKHYFYADLPKGYQITQYHHPICEGGALTFDAGLCEKTVRIHRIHIEEDAGKNVHDELLAGQRSYVDFNRAGVPLVEIVTEPDLRSAAEAAAFMRALRQLLLFLGVCDGNMEEGSLRCDANVSLRPKGQEKLGTRAEIKNLNSFRFVQQAIEYEILRQEDILSSGGTVVQETRLWDTQGKCTRSMRSKEEAHDYRYFPEPDLPELLLTQEYIQDVGQTLPELPRAKQRRYQEELGLSADDARTLVDDPQVAAFFEAALALHDNAKALANWLINDVLGALKGRRLQALPITPVTLAELVGLIDDGTISGKIAKSVFAQMVESGGTPKEIVEAKGLKQVTDVTSIEPVVDAVMAANPDSVASYKAGKQNAIGFLVGQVMKQTKGQANPKLVNELLRKKLQ